jgi:hypothetical protein
METLRELRDRKPLDEISYVTGVVAHVFRTR